ncbi:PE-PPE domain-containing protein [Mycobacterium sp. 134]|uniref:PE-PPE domain-containing protein n=1 Tax=Mycobacterium sp. 134 TaxID=3400425 RepID=UPI003AAA67BE
MRFSPRSAARSLLVGAVALSGSAAIAVTTTFTADVVLSATVLVVPGTGTPNPALSQNYEDHAVQYYVAPGSTCTDVTCVGVPYIAQFWPFPFAGWGGLEGAKWNVSVQSGVSSLATAYGAQLTPPAPGQEQNYNPDHEVVIFGYSQGATVAGIYKRDLAYLNNPTDPTLPTNVSFVLIGNPNRPNGGLFERLAALGTVPVLDATFGNPTPTDTAPDGVINTDDIALQYDGVADAPSWVLNPLSLVNALAGFEYVHGTYLAPKGNDEAGATPYGYTPEQVQAAVANAQANCSEATHCQVHGDTRYITLPAKYLPIMQPLIDLGAATGTSAVVIPLVDLVSPAMQTLIETGYDRGDYGSPTPFQLVPRVNPVKLVTDLINDIPEGIQAARNPGLDPLPGWSDPTQSADTANAPEAVKVSDTTAIAPESPKLPAPPKLNVLKVNPLAETTTDGEDTPAPEIKRPKLRAGDIHPARDLAKSIRSTVRKALGGQNSTEGAKGTAKVKAANTTEKKPAA